MVLVGFGSTGLFGSTLHHTDYVELAAGFSALAPTRVLWPLIPTNLPNGTRLEELPLGDNVLVVPWVDYNDVLGEGDKEGERTFQSFAFSTRVCVAELSFLLSGDQHEQLSLLHGLAGDMHACNVLLQLYL